MPKRETYSIRLSPKVLQQVDLLADRHQLPRATVIRTMLSVAIRRPSEVEALLATLSEADA